MTLYVYTTKKDSTATNWDDAISNNEVEVVATISGEDQTAVVAAAEERFSDTDKYGYSYSDDIPEAEIVERFAGKQIK